MNTRTLALLAFAPLAFLSTACGEKEVEADDSGIEADADADADTDTDTDADADADSDADADADSDADADPVNYFKNPGFEEVIEEGVNTKPAEWLVYPADLANYDTVATGDTLYESEETFTAYSGNRSLKVFGNWSGWPNESPVYQEMAATPGTEYTFFGQAWMHSDDPLLATHTYSQLEVRFFSADFGQFENAVSAPISSASGANTWTELSATGTAPDWAAIVQGSIIFWQCFEDTSEGNCWDGNGAVYYDDIVFTY